MTSLGGGSEEVHGESDLVAAIRHAVADGVLGNEDLRLTPAQLPLRLPVVSPLRDDEVAGDDGQHGPPVRVRMRTVARTDRPEQDAGVDAAPLGHGDLDLSRELRRCDGEVSGNAALVKAGIGDESGEGARGALDVSGRRRELVDERGEEAAVRDLDLDRLVHRSERDAARMPRMG